MPSRFTKRTIAVYALLLGGLALAAVWQLLEHRRVQESLRTGLVNRAHDICASLEVVLHSQRRFGVVPRPRLEGALRALVSSDELLAVSLLNPLGDVVASAGNPAGAPLTDVPPGTVIWGEATLTVSALIELGPERGPRGPRRGPPVEAEEEKKAGAVLWNPPDPPPDAASRSRPAAGDSTPVRPAAAPSVTPAAAPAAAADSRVTGENDAGAATRATGESDAAEREARDRRRRSFWHALRGNHPYWMSEEKFREAYEKQGLHGFVLVLSSGAAESVAVQDLWLRRGMVGIALMAAIGLAIAWHSRERSAELTMRLVQSRAMNTYLRELNVAAAGLAHETRNPLNIVRGAVQLIGKDPVASNAARRSAATVLDEVDRIAARLSEFIDYSKPRQPKLAPTSLAVVVRDVERTLETDIDDKNITFDMACPELIVEADEALLRQVVFNLILNASQAVDRGGWVSVSTHVDNAKRVTLEVTDDGPGVPEEARADIFRPYFTLSEEGTGLGLAVVRQIVLAHHWEIDYIAPTGGGSTFRIRGLQLVRKVT